MSARFDPRSARGAQLVLVTVGAVAIVLAPVVAQQFDGGHAKPTGIVGSPVFDVADLDGDGDLDVAAAYPGDAIVWFANGPGSAGFGPAQAVDPLAPAASALVLADVDGDGDWDAVTGDYATGAVAWYANVDGAGAFGPRQTVSTQAGLLADVIAADLDGDGDVDLASARYDAGELQWYENQGGESFSAPVAIDTTPMGLYTLHAADVDGDGTVELFAGGVGYLVRYVFDGSPDGFADPQLISFGLASVRAIDSADVDGDGDLDLWVASDEDDRVLWFEHQGGGAFGPGTDIGGLYGTSDVLPADLDGDGDQDVLVASNLYFDLAWAENLDGLGQFAALGYLSTGQVWPNGRVGAIDLDGDGFVEAVSMHQNYPNISQIRWWTNLQEHLAAEPATVSVSTGGAQAFDLRAGATNAGALYLVVGSASGTAPATPFGGADWPLVIDAYSLFTIANAGGALLPGTVGLLDASGTADAALVVPAGTDPALAGATLHQAFGLFDLTAPAGESVTLVSNAVALTLSP